VKETWSFRANEFNGKGEEQQLGSISITHDNGITLWFAAVERSCVFDESDQQFIDRVLRVLNRELPGGQLRVRRKGASNAD